MQIGKNMDKTLKFVYVLILFISIFLVIIVSDALNPYLGRLCKTDKDCTKIQNYNIRCRNSYCVQI